MRALVTGLNGFMGKHLKSELAAHGYEVSGLTGADARRLDIRDREAMRAAVRTVRPDCVFHLAAQSLASRSWREPQETMEVNAVGAANLLETLRMEAPEAKVLLVGSSDQYGILNAGCGAIRKRWDRYMRPHTACISV